MGEIWVYDPEQGKCVLKGAVAPYRGHYIISDTIPGLWHPSDGRTYDSKSTFRSVTKAHGGIEVGNEKQSFRPQMDRVSKADVARAIEKVNAGYRPRIGNENDG